MNSPLSFVAPTFESWTAIGKGPLSASRAAKLSFTGAASASADPKNSRPSTAIPETDAVNRFPRIPPFIVKKAHHPTLPGRGPNDQREQ
jgi:hypothetical protein